MLGASVNQRFEVLSVSVLQLFISMRDVSIVFIPFASSAMSQEAVQMITWHPLSNNFLCRFLFWDGSIR